MTGVTLFLMVTALCTTLAENVTRQITKPYVESYWETWDSWKDFPDDYCAILKDVPATPVGSNSGVNLINVAFGDFSEDMGGTNCPDEMIREGIKAIHDKGGFAKLALGGALYSMSSYVTTEAEAKAWAERLVTTVQDYGLDGIDLDVEDSAVAGDVQVVLISHTRQLLGPSFHISYTIPALSAQYEPWLSTIMGAIDHLDAVNIMAYDYYWDGYDISQDVEMLEIMGVPRDKMVYGLMPGHSDAPNEYTSLEDAENAARYAKEQGLGGVMTWDLNRDAYQRKNYPAGEDNLGQTGQADGAYINLLSQTLNQ